MCKIGTATDEPHGLHAAAALEGSHGLFLGTQTPIREIARTEGVRNMDVVAMPFSSHYLAGQVMPSLELLREGLPDECDIWVGGEGARRLTKSLPGMRTVVYRAEIPVAVRTWRDMAERGGFSNRASDLLVSSPLDSAQGA